MSRAILGGFPGTGISTDTHHLKVQIQSKAPRSKVRRSPSLPSAFSASRSIPARRDSGQASALKPHPACKSHAKLRGKPQIPLAPLHNIVAKTRVLRGKTRAVIAHSRGKSGKNRVKTGRFALHAESSTPQNRPGARQMRLRPPKNAPKIRPPPKKKFRNFLPRRSPDPSGRSRVPPVRHLVRHNPGAPGQSLPACVCSFWTPLGGRPGSAFRVAFPGNG